MSEGAGPAPTPEQGSAPPNPQGGRGLMMLVLAGLWLTVPCLAWFGHPLWDDASLAELVARDPALVLETVQDRPQLARLVYSLASAGWLLPAAWATQLGLMAAFAWGNTQLWRHVVGGSERWTSLVALLSLSLVFVQSNLILVWPTFGSLTGPALTVAALGLAMRPVVHPMAMFVACAAALVGGVLSEYGLPTAISAGVAALVMRAPGASFRTAWWARCTAVAAASALGFAWLRLGARAGFREDVSSSYLLDTLRDRGIGIVQHAAEDAWQAVVGNILEAGGHLGAADAPGWALLLGACVAVLWSRQQPAAADTADESGSSWAKPMMASLAAVGVHTLVVTAMGREVGIGIESRYLLPVLPWLVAFWLLVLHAVFRSTTAAHRAQAVVLGLVLAHTGAWGQSLFDHRERVDRWAVQLAPLQALEGNTSVYWVGPEGPLGRLRPYEIRQAITTQWPLDAWPRLNVHIGRTDVQHALFSNGMVFPAVEIAERGLERTFVPNRRVFVTELPGGDLMVVTAPNGDQLRQLESWESAHPGQPSERRWTFPIPANPGFLSIAPFEPPSPQPLVPGVP